MISSYVGWECWIEWHCKWKLRSGFWFHRASIDRASARWWEPGIPAFLLLLDCGNRSSGGKRNQRIDEKNLICLESWAKKLFSSLVKSLGKGNAGNFWFLKEKLPRRTLPNHGSLQEKFVYCRAWRTGLPAGEIRFQIQSTPGSSYQAEFFFREKIYEKRIEQRNHLASKDKGCWLRTNSGPKNSQRGKKRPIHQSRIGWFQRLLARIYIQMIWCSLTQSENGPFGDWTFSQSEKAVGPDFDLMARAKAGRLTTGPKSLPRTLFNSAGIPLR